MGLLGGVQPRAANPHPTLPPRRRSRLRRGGDAQMALGKCAASGRINGVRGWYRRCTAVRRSRVCDPEVAGLNGFLTGLGTIK